MLLLALSLLSFADIPPPEGYVEDCTVANHGEDCMSCSAWHGGREDCEALEAKGYGSVCKTRGASTWSEVMCPGKGPNAIAEPTPPPPPTPDVETPTPPTPPAPTIEAKPMERVPGPASAPVRRPASDGTSSKCATLAPAGLAPLGLLLPLVLRRRRRSTK